MPPNEDIMYKEKSLAAPSPFSKPDPMIKVEMTLRDKCTKLACKKVGVMNLHSWYSFLIFLQSFQPRRSSDLGFGAKNSVLTILNRHKDTMKRIISSKTIQVVKEQNLSVGQRLILIASKRVSSLALFLVGYYWLSALLG